MRIFTFLSILLIAFNALAVAPYGIKGQQNGAVIYPNVHQFPNNQVTNMGGINALIETGNKNILSNPSFESVLVAGVIPSWNWGGNFPGISTSEVIDGKKSAVFTAVGDTITLTQDSNLYSSAFSGGVQGLASVRIKSDVALKVCARQAGATSTTLCVDVVANNKWSLYKVPMILGGTSNGISIASTGAVSGTVYIDDAFVGATDLTQNINACNDVSCETEFSAKVSSTDAVTEENISFINGNCTNATTGRGTCTYDTGIFSVTPNCLLTGDNGEIVYIVTQSSSAITYETRNSAGVAVNYAVNISCQKQGVDFTNAKQLSNGNTYSSTNADTDWEDAGTIIWSTTGGAQTKGTTTVDKVLVKRTGTNAEIIYKFEQTGGAVGSGDYLYTLPNGLEFDTTVVTPYSGAFSTGLEKAGQNALVGYGHITTGAGTSRGAVSLFAYSSTQFRVVATSAFTGYSIQNASYFASGTLAFNFKINAPIAGWQNSNIIIGQFNGLESCASTLDCTDTFSARINAAATVLSENADFLDGNCTLVDTGDFTCNFKSGIFTQTPSCVISSGQNPAALEDVTIGIFKTLSSTQAQIKLESASNTELNLPFNIVCQKQGADYTGKTAKSVASDQSVATPGITKIKSCYVRYSGSASDVTVCNSTPCVIREDTCGGASVTMPAVAEYILTFPAGKFSPNSYVYCSIQGSRQDTNSNMWYTNFYDATLQTFKSASDGSFRHNFGFYTGSGYSYNFGNIKCEGKAP